MTTVPIFDNEGVLPRGDYTVTLAELRQSHLVAGLSTSPHWDSQWRAQLVDNLEILVKQLFNIGITEILSMAHSPKTKIIRTILTAISKLIYDVLPLARSREN